MDIHTCNRCKKTIVNGVNAVTYMYGQNKYILLCNPTCDILGAIPPYPNTCSFCDKELEQRDGILKQNGLSIMPKKDTYVTYMCCSATCVQKKRNVLKADIGVVYQCGGCGKLLDTPKICSKCKSAYYCDVECQKKHWKSHRIACDYT